MISRITGTSSAGHPNESWMKDKLVMPARTMPLTVIDMWAASTLCTQLGGIALAEASADTSVESTAKVALCCTFFSKLRFHTSSVSFTRSCSE